MRLSQKKSKNQSRREKIFDPLRGNVAGGAPDYGLLIIVGIILLLGFLLLSSATSIISFESSADSYGLLKQQLLHGFLPGLVLFFIAIRIDYFRYKKYSWLFWLGSIILLAMVFIPGLSSAHNNAKSWINIGGIVFQTSEVAKLLFIMWAAGWLAARQKTIKDFKSTTLPFFLMTGLICLLLILQPDLGTMLIFIGVAVAIFTLANANLFHVGALAILGTSTAALLIRFTDYGQRRFLTFLNPETDIQGAGYQIHQALIAIGSGHWWGLGIGQSRQKFNYLPEIASDSIFAIIGEELGFVFSTVIIILFIMLFVKGVLISRRSQDTYGSLIALGISILIALQVLINIGAMIGLLPLTGIPLPFISLGGTNLAILMAAVGILANISKHTKPHA